MKEFYTIRGEHTEDSETVWRQVKAPLQALVLDFGLVPSIDATGIIALQELVKSLLEEGVAVALVVPHHSDTYRQGARRHFKEYRNALPPNPTDHEVPTEMQQQQFNLLNKLPDTLLPSLLPIKLRKSVDSIMKLITQSPIKPLPNLELGGFIDDLGKDSVFETLQEALDTLHQRGVISEPPVYTVKAHV